MLKTRERERRCDRGRAMAVHSAEQREMKPIYMCALSACTSHLKITFAINNMNMDVFMYRSMCRAKARNGSHVAYYYARQVVEAQGIFLIMLPFSTCQWLCWICYFFYFCRCHVLFNNIVSWFYVSQKRCSSFYVFPTHFLTNQHAYTHTST